jgi:S-DNA-T family DNA segregation ATPase FtsK/SpoIIIE
MSDAFSVTEIRNALRCPRIFALGRANGSAVAFPVGSSCLGAAFHRIVERFSKTVAAPPPDFANLGKGAALDDVDAKLRLWLLGFLEDELEEEPAYSTMPGEIDDLAQAIRELARHLAARLRPFDDKPSRALERLLKDAERPLEAVVDGVLVRGTLDALYAAPDGSLDVVEYKLTDEANDALDRAQVALYAHMHETMERKTAKPVILRFMPMLRETTVGEAEASDMMARVVRPLLGKMQEWAKTPGSAPATERRDLCAACPMAGPCAATYPERVAPRDDPPACASRPRPDNRGSVAPAAPIPVTDAAPTDDDGRREAESLRDRIVSELTKQGVMTVCPRPPTVGPTLYEIEVTRPRGSVKQLDQAANDVRHRLGSDGIDVEYDARGGRRVFVVKRSMPRKVLLGPLLSELRPFLAEKPGRFIVGQRPTGEILTGDLSDASTPHLLVGGQSGSGKSFLLRALIASLVHYHAPSAIRFVLIDPKRVTFNQPAFRSAVSAHLDVPIVYDAEEAIPILERLIETMEERYELFEKTQVIDIDEYNDDARPSERLERKIVVIDEFQDLAADKASAKVFCDGIKRLGAKARAAGLHVILATQRPDKDTVPPIIKTNLGGKIALRVATQTNSRIILDEGGAERLLGKGDLLANLGHGVVRAQAPMVG